MNILNLYSLPLTLEKNIIKNNFKGFTSLIKKYYKKSLTIIFGTLVVQQFKYASLYHLFKRQDFAKCYVIFNILELIEKLVQTVIQDLNDFQSASMSRNDDIDNNCNNDFNPGFVDSVVDMNQGSHFNRISFDKSSGKSFNCKLNCRKDEKSDESIALNSINNFSDGENNFVKKSIKNFKNFKFDKNEITRKDHKNSGIFHIFTSILFLICNILQCLILNFEFILLRISMNKRGDLFALLISNVFMDLKGTIFKKVNRKSMIDILQNDVEKRFKLLIITIMIIFVNFKEMIGFEWNNILLPLIVILFKICIDWVKHIFLCRYNDVDLNIYNFFKEKEDESLGLNLMITSFVFNILTSY
ncbi:Protein TAPT1 like protein [Dictyocoela muelleri]|nr:Protein TAPT1 like protein [Dictyocoela muelleri]